MTCSHCSTQNEDGVLYCRECHTLFLDQEIDGPPPDGDERILLLAQMCELLHNGEWDLPTFRQELHVFTAEQERREAEVQSVYQSVPIGLEEDFQEEMETGFHGVQAVKTALSELAEYDPDVNPYASMQHCLYLFYKGACTVKEAMNINRRNRGRPLWI